MGRMFTMVWRLKNRSVRGIKVLGLARSLPVVLLERGFKDGLTGGRAWTGSNGHIEACQVEPGLFATSVGMTIAGEGLCVA